MGMHREQDKIQNKKRRDIDRTPVYELDKHKTSTCFKPSPLLSAAPNNPQSPTAPLEKSNLPQKQRRSRVRWCKSVNLRLQDIRGKKKKKHPINQQQTHEIDNSFKYESGQIINDWNP